MIRNGPCPPVKNRKGILKILKLFYGVSNSASISLGNGLYGTQNSRMTASPWTDKHDTLICKVATREPLREKQFVVN